MPAELITCSQRRIHWIGSVVRENTDTTMTPSSHCCNFRFCLLKQATCKVRSRTMTNSTKKLRKRAFSYHGQASFATSTRILGRSIIATRFPPPPPPPTTPRGPPPPPPPPPPTPPFFF